MKLLTGWGLCLAVAFVVLAGLSWIIFWQRSDLNCGGPTACVSRACQAMGVAGYHRLDGGICFGYFASPADPNTFRELEYGFAVDAKSAYWNGSAVPDSDPVTFMVLPYRDGAGSVSPDPYSKDGRQVFISSYDDNPPFGQVRLLPGADPRTFEVLLSEARATTIGYAKDDDQVWLFGIMVEDADAPTFELSPIGLGFDAKDKKRRYLNGIPVSDTTRSATN